MPNTCDVVVLLSGTGSNLQALIDSTRTGDSPVRIAAVISNRADAYGLQRARVRVSIPASWITRLSRAARPSMPR